MGLSRDTFLAMSPESHLAQSIADILTTPRGSRVMLRDYGSDLPALIDAPLNGETAIELYQATAEALAAWEPRFTLVRVQIAEAKAGRATLALEGRVQGDPVQLDVALGAAA